MANNSNNHDGYASQRLLPHPTVPPAARHDVGALRGLLERALEHLEVARIVYVDEGMERRVAMVDQLTADLQQVLSPPSKQQRR